MADITDFSLTDSYIPAYKAYLHFGDEQKTGLVCLQQHIPRAVDKLQLGKDKPTFNILSIGAGDGFVDQEILKTVQKGCLNAKEEVEIVNTALEPNSKFLDQYKESIERRSDMNTEASKKRPIHFDLRPLTFEGYAESKHGQNQYDMVHAIHSLYYVDSIESTLKHCYYNELREKGLIVCLFGNDSDLAGTTSMVIEKCRSKCHRKTWIGNNPVATLIHFAEKNLMKYEKVVVPFPVDVTSIFDESSEEGRHLLDFFTHEVNYRQTRDQDEVKEVVKKLKEISTEDGNGRLIVNCTHELLLIYKSPS